MTSPIGNPLKIQFNGSRSWGDVGVGGGWMICCFLCVVFLLVQFDVILVQVGCFLGNTLGMDAPQKDWKSGWISRIYWVYGSRS